MRIRIIGDRAQVSDKLREAWEQAEAITRDNTRITLSVAFNYGGRWDVVQACRRAMQDGVPPEKLDEATLGSYMALSHAPDPDLFIRTGGELRISNFLLWQAAYSELVFTECLWPDFDDAELDAAISDFAGARPALRPGEERRRRRPPAPEHAQAARHHGHRAAGAAAACALRGARPGRSPC